MDNWTEHIMEYIRDVGDYDDDDMMKNDNDDDDMMTNGNDEFTTKTTTILS